MFSQTPRHVYARRVTSEKLGRDPVDIPMFDAPVRSKKHLDTDTDTCRKPIYPKGIYQSSWTEPDIGPGFRSIRPADVEKIRQDNDHAWQAYYEHHPGETFGPLWRPKESFINAHKRKPGLRNELMEREDYHLIPSHARSQTDPNLYTTATARTQHATVGHHLVHNERAMDHFRSPASLVHYHEGAPRRHDHTHVTPAMTSHSENLHMVEGQHAKIRNPTTHQPTYEAKVSSQARQGETVPDRQVPRSMVREVPHTHVATSHPTSANTVEAYMAHHRAANIHFQETTPKQTSRPWTMGTSVSETYAKSAIRPHPRHSGYTGTSNDGRQPVTLAPMQHQPGHMQKVAASYDTATDKVQRDHKTVQHYQRNKVNVQRGDTNSYTLVSHELSKATVDGLPSGRYIRQRATPADPGVSSAQRDEQHTVLQGYSNQHRTQRHVDEKLGPVMSSRKNLSVHFAPGLKSQ